MREGREFESRRSRQFLIRLVIILKSDRPFFKAMTFSVYILKSLKDGSYYVGSTNNLEDRFKRHNEGRVAYTKPRRPWKLVYSEEHPDRSSAARRENEIKAHKRSAFIETLIKSSQN
jgi:putative endonuclease